MTKKFKNTTADDLAVMIKRGFDGVDKKFENVDRRLDRVDEKIEKMDKRLDNIELLLSVKYQRRIEILERKVARLEELLAVR